MLGLEAKREVTSMTQDETRSMKASAAVANKDREPVLMAAYSWITKRQKLAMKDAFTANLTLGPFSSMSRAARRSSAPLSRNWSIRAFCLV
jgi:hypothetical protein